MLKALVWKEWREQRPLLLSGLLLAALWPLFMAAFKYSSSAPLDLASVAEALPIAYALVLWPLFTVAAGASTIANEIGDRTLEYLLSRPVSRVRVWGVKLAVGATSALTIVAGSLGIVLVVRALALGPGGATTPFDDLTYSLEGGAFALITVEGAIFLLFSFAAFFSSFLPRAMTAAAAGTGASIAVFALVSVIWSRLDLVPRVEPQWMALEITVIGAIVLLASLFVFSRGDMLRGRGVAGTVVIASLCITGAAGVALIPLLYVQLRLSPSDAILGDASLSPTGDAVVLTARSRGLASPEIWLVHSDAPGLTRLAGRLTFGAVFSPDGRWVAYLSNRTALGLRSDHVDLRAARSDGSEDRLLAADVAASANFSYYQAPTLVFSPDGAKVALSTWRGLMVASMEGGPVNHLDPGLTFSGLVIGWTRDGREILAPGKMDRGGIVTIRAYDSTSGRSRDVYKDMHSSAWLYWWKAPAKGLTLLPMTLKRGETRSESYPLLLLNVADGRTRTLSESGCFALPALTEDERHVAYASCTGTLGGDRRSAIHVLDLTSGEDRSVTSIAGEALELQLSPGATRILVRLRRSVDTPPTDLIVDAHGVVRDVDAGWESVGWTGRDRLLLSHQDPDTPGPARLAVLNLETGVKLEVFP